MPTSSRPPRLTYDDFLLFPDDGQRHELIDGEHYVTPSPGTRHQLLVGRIFYAIETHLRSHRAQGQVFLAPFDVVLSRWDVVEPDLVVIGGDQSGILTHKNIQGPPALVIEVLSPGTRKRDEQVKRDLYERMGILEYWLVDPDANRVAVYRRGKAGSFQRVPVLFAAARSVLSTPVLPDFSLALDEIFAPGTA
jgi:Uma2 family endonuclease